MPDRLKKYSNVADFCFYTYRAALGAALYVYLIFSTSVLASIRYSLSLCAMSCNASLASL